METFFFFTPSILGIKSRALCMLGKCSTTDLHPCPWKTPFNDIIQIEFFSSEEARLMSWRALSDPRLMGLCWRRCWFSDLLMISCVVLPIVTFTTGSLCPPALLTGATGLLCSLLLFFPDQVTYPRRIRPRLYILHSFLTSFLFSMPGGSLDRLISRM